MCLDLERRSAHDTKGNRAAVGTRQSRSKLWWGNPLNRWGRLEIQSSRMFHTWSLWYCCLCRCVDRWGWKCSYYFLLSLIIKLRVNHKHMLMLAEIQIGAVTQIQDQSMRPVSFKVVKTTSIQPVNPILVLLLFVFFIPTIPR